MVRIVTIVALLLTLSGCGLGETAATAGAGAAAKAEELKQAKQTQERIEQRLDDANRQAAEQRRAAEEIQQ